MLTYALLALPVSAGGILGYTGSNPTGWDDPDILVGATEGSSSLAGGGVVTGARRGAASFAQGWRLALRDCVNAVC
jgi:hypothetical protein